jgi:hypothetical protein
MRHRFLRISAVLVLVAIGALAAPSSREKLGFAATHSTSPIDGVPLPSAQQAMHDTLHLLVGDTFALAISPPADSAQPARYSSTDSSIVTVSPTGVVRALARGTGTVTSTSLTSHSFSVVPVVVMTRREGVNAMVNEVCPNEDESAIRNSQPIASDLPIIHEYHDCQRLIVGGSYGPVVGIFAHHNVQNANTWESFRNGLLAAVIVNFVTKGQAIPYSPLGIEPGTSCLVIRASGPEQWEAALVPQRNPVMVGAERRYGSCDDRLSWASVPRSRRVPLTVRLQRAMDMNSDPVAPPTARWDWDPTHHINYIGVKCDARTWCEIGPPDFVPSVAQVNPDQRPLFKGYYDEQFLADTGVVKRPSEVFGTLMPGDDMKDTHTMKHWWPRWYDAANLWLREVPGGASRATSAPLRPLPQLSAIPGATTAGGPPLPSFDFYLRKFKGIVPGRIAGARYALGTLQMKPIKFWVPNSSYHVEINGAREPTWEIVYFSHPSSSLKVATVRWRWTERDENTWSYCDPAGCCELRGTAEK